MADALGLQTEEDGCEHQQTPTPSPEPQCGTGAGSSPVLSKRRTLPPISNEWVAPKMAIVILVGQDPPGQNNQCAVEPLLTRTLRCPRECPSILEFSH